MQVTLIILAAGRGTRMNSDLPKVLHPLNDIPILHHTMQAGQSLRPSRTVVVTGHEAEAVEAAARDFDDHVICIRQKEQKGTAHAVLQAAPLLANLPGDAIVLYGDTPFIRTETLAAMLEARRRHAIVVLGFRAADPARYGRLIAKGDILERIVEFKDATADERAVTLCNSGVVCADTSILIRLCAAVGNNNAAKEFYLTDIVAIARTEGLSAGIVFCDEDETQGINTSDELALAETFLKKQFRGGANKSIIE
jgi:bifunctional UDP-N-acetylglucosamine pyrophosphorylase/glucosamine-1-phosphate N-acetyltransferase